MKLRKLTVMMACVAVSGLLMCACGSSNDAGNGNGTADTNTEVSETDTAAESQAAETPSAATGYVYTLNGVEVFANEKMSAIVDQLGEPTSYFESESCAFQGLDKVYTYGSVVISTYPQDGEDFVYTIELKDDTVETAEGICIGSSKDDVVAAYGTAASETDTALTYQKDDCVLAFILDGDSVTNITYTAITE